MQSLLLQIVTPGHDRTKLILHKINDLYNSTSGTAIAIRGLINLPGKIVMKKLSDNLKQALNALAFQDAGEFLSTRDKLEVLGYGNKKTKHPLILRQKAHKIETPKRIALITNEKGNGAQLDYAIDACKRQGGNARLDILLHGAMTTEATINLEKRIKQAAQEYQIIRLGVNAVEDLINYIRNHSSLIFLISKPEDKVARVLIEEVMPKSEEHIQLPVVLIEGNSSARYQKQSAA